MSFWGGMMSAATNYAQSDNFYGDLFEGILGGLSASAAAKGDKKSQQIAGEYSLRGIREAGTEARRTAEFQTALEKWMKDKEKEERRSGFGNFNRFSSVDYGEPTYRPPPVGAMPSASTFGNPGSLAQAAQQQGGTIPQSLYANVVDSNAPSFGGRRGG